MSELVATLRLRFDEASDAARVGASLQPDDDAFVTTRVEDAMLFVEARARDLKALRRALDDVLACAAISEAVITPGSFDE